MPNRYTDTEKWKDPWFCGLTEQERMFWVYICDNCDYAGIWKVNWSLVRFFINGFIFVIEHFNVEQGKDRIIIIDNHKWFLPKFILYQYGGLNLSVKLHLKIYRILESHSVVAGLSQSEVRALLQYNNSSLEDLPTSIVDDTVFIKKSIKYGDFEKVFLKKWQDLCDKFPSISTVRGISGTRREKLHKRFNEEIFRENIDHIFTAIAEQPFLTHGNPNSKDHSNWRISFDWLITNDTNYMKVLEYRYKKQINEQSELEETRRQLGLKR